MGLSPLLRKYINYYTVTAHFNFFFPHLIPDSTNIHAFFLLQFTFINKHVVFGNFDGRVTPELYYDFMKRKKKGEEKEPKNFEIHFSLFIRIFAINCSHISV